MIDSSLLLTAFLVGGTFGSLFTRIDIIGLRAGGGPYKKNEHNTHRKMGLVRLFLFVFESSST